MFVNFYMAESFFADGFKYMTALLEYLDLLCDVREVKLLHANQKEQSFLIYLTHLIVLCVYPEKYTSLLVWHPGYLDLRALLCAGYLTP